MLRHTLRPYPSLISRAVKNTMTNKNIFVRPMSVRGSDEAWYEGQTGDHAPDRTDRMLGPIITSGKNMSMDRRDDVAYEFAENLISKGYDCIVYIESKELRIGWCGRNVCTNV